MARKVHVDNSAFAAMLPYRFEDCELTLAGWGNVDCHAKYQGTQVLLEIEKTQTHPNTNVTKIWPYLDSNPDVKVLLVQLFLPENKASRNRRNLCEFMGKKLEDLFPNRFRYLKCNDLSKPVQRKIKQKLIELQ